MRGADVDATGGMVTDKACNIAPDAAIRRGGGARGRSGGRVRGAADTAAGGKGCGGGVVDLTVCGR